MTNLFPIQEENEENNMIALKMSLDIQLIKNAVATQDDLRFRNFKVYFTETISHIIRDMNIYRDMILDLNKSEFTEFLDSILLDICSRL
jgi:hypothetical protein